MSLVGLVVVDASAVHVDDAVSNINTTAIAIDCLVVGHDVAVDGDVALLVVDAAAILFCSVVVDDGRLGGIVEAVAGGAGSDGDVAGIGEDAAAAAGDGLVFLHIATVEQDVAIVVVDAAAVDVGAVVDDVGIVGKDGAVFQVDAAAASGGVRGGTVLATGLVLHHVGAKQADGVAEALVGVGMGAFAENGATVAQGCRIVVKCGMAHVHTTRMVVEGAAVDLGNIVEDPHAVIQRRIHVGAGELEQVDVAHVGVGAAAVAFFSRVVRQRTAIEDDVARVVVGAAAVQGGGVVLDDGVVGDDGASVGIHAAALFGPIEGNLDLVVLLFSVNIDGALVGIDTAAVLAGRVESDLRLFAEDIARIFYIVLNVDVALVGVDAAAAVAGLVATVGVTFGRVDEIVGCATLVIILAAIAMRTADVAAVHVDVALVVVDAAAVMLGVVVLEVDVCNGDFSLLQIHTAATAIDYTVGIGGSCAIDGPIINKVSVLHGDVLVFCTFTHTEDAAAAAVGGLVVGDGNALLFAGAENADVTFVCVQSAAVDACRVVDDFGSEAFVASGIDVDVAFLGVNATAVFICCVAVDGTVYDGDSSFLQVHSAT